MIACLRPSHFSTVQYNIRCISSCFVYNFSFSQFMFCLNTQSLLSLCVNSI